MSRLVGADILLDILDLMIVGHKSAGDVYDVVDSMPTVDAVEVVRCKDCKFNYANQIPSENACQLCVELPISDEFYCAYGERIEDEAD